MQRKTRISTVEMHKRSKIPFINFFDSLKKKIAIQRGWGGGMVCMMYAKSDHRGRISRLRSSELIMSSFFSSSGVT